MNGTRPSVPAKHDFRISAGKRHRLRAHFWNDAKSPMHSSTLVGVQANLPQSRIIGKFDLSGDKRGQVSEMYGPPSDCKGKVLREKVCVNVSGLWWRFVLLAMMRYAACLSLETPRPCEGPIGKQVSGTPL